ncbi:MAG: hypothetical protein QNJ87_14860 [Gammaproteobacteria bacterium]|nr:hypothetical protein [Gammaproteobacteria bacterium]
MPPPTRSRRRLRRPTPDGNRTSRDALTIGEVFETAIADVLEMRSTLGYTGVVDIGVTFKSVSVDRDGFVSVLIGGNDSQETTTQIQLATRVHLDDDAK